MLCAIGFTCIVGGLIEMTVLLFTTTTTTTTTTTSSSTSSSSSSTIITIIWMLELLYSCKLCRRIITNRAWQGGERQCLIFELITSRL